MPEPSATDRRLTVLYLVDSLRGAGGAEGTVLRMVQRLPQDRFRSIVVTFDANPNWIRNFPSPVHVLPLNRKTALSTAWKIHRLLRTNRVSILHTFFAVSDFFGGIIAWLSRCPVIISSRRDMGILVTPRQQRAYRILHGLFDQVQAVSEAVRRSVIARDRMPEDRVVTVYNGVDLEKFPLIERRGEVRDSDAPVIVTLGNIRHVKGCDVLIKAAAILRDRFPKLRVRIAGGVNDPAYHAELCQTIERLGLKDSVELSGPCYDINALLRTADVFCLPSRSEGFSNALLEAMAGGLPCVATDVGGNAELVENNGNGYVVPSDDPRAMADALAKLLIDPAKARAMGLRGRRIVEERFTVEAMIGTLVREYERFNSPKMPTSMTAGSGAEVGRA